MTETHEPDPWGEAMTARLFGEIEREPRRLLEEHMQRSPEVRRQWEQMSEFFDALSAVPMPDAPADLEATLLKKLMNPAEGTVYSPSQAPVPVRPAVARIALVQGDVRVATNRRAAADKSAAWLLAMEGDVLVEGSLVEIGPGGRALLRLNDSSELWLNANTLLRFGKRAAGAFVRLMRGEVLAFVAKQRRALPILTPDGMVSVLGTVFDTRLREDGGTEVSVLDGRVSVASGAGKREVTAHRRVKVQRGVAVPKTTRMSGSEVRRLHAWTSSLAAASRAESRNLVQSTRRRGLARVGIAAAITIAALAGGVALWSTKSEPTLSEEAAALRANATAVEPYTPSLPPPVRFFPSLGSQWREELHATGTVLMQRVGGADIRYEATIRIATLSRVLSPEGTETARFQHRVADADFQLTGDVQEAQDDIDEARAAMREALTAATFTEYRGPRWELLSVSLDNALELQPVQHAALQTVWASLIAIPAGLPTQPLTQGMQWTHAPSLEAMDTLALGAESTVTGFAMRDNNPLAMLNTSLTGSLTAPFRVGPAIAMLIGMSPEIKELNLQTQGVTELRLSDSVPIMTTGQVDERWVIDLGPTAINGRERERVVRVRLNLETTLSIAPMTSAP